MGKSTKLDWPDRSCWLGAAHAGGIAWFVDGAGSAFDEAPTPTRETPAALWSVMVCECTAEVSWAWAPIGDPIALATPSLVMRTMTAATKAHVRFRLANPFHFSIFARMPNPTRSGEY